MILLPSKMAFFGTSLVFLKSQRLNKVGRCPQQPRNCFHLVRHADSPHGYSCSGQVVRIGAKVNGLTLGDLVIDWHFEMIRTRAWKSRHKIGH